MIKIYDTGDSDIQDGDSVQDSEVIELPTILKKRGIFPKPATNILRTWLFQNLAVSKPV